MKLLIAILLAVSCGSTQDYLEPRVPGRPAPEGPQGPAGEPGAAGNNGLGCVSERFETGILVQCGGYSHVVYDGSDGQAGDDGTNCSVEQGDNSATITCEDGSTAIIYAPNGSNKNCNKD